MAAVTIDAYRGNLNRAEYFNGTVSSNSVHVEAGGGDDAAYGGSQADTLFGQGGRDLLYAGVGDDLLFGDYTADDSTNAKDGGADLILGYDGSDTLYGATGNDYISGGAQNDSAFGGADNDLIYGGAGSDLVDGGTGNDTLFGSSPESYDAAFWSDIVVDFDGTTGQSYSSSYVFGAASVMSVFGLEPTDTAPDTLFGGDGDDKIYGSQGRDTIAGDAGNDTVASGAGADKLAGGDGTDSLDYSASAAAVNVNLATGIGSGGDAEGDRFTSFERIIGSGYSDRLTGDGSVNLLAGGSGNDILDGAAGNDSLEGGAGKDVLTGGQGRDILTGGSDADRFVFAARTETSTGANRDIITDFRHADGDRIDLSAIDANNTTSANDAFKFIGTAAFTHHAGELHVVYSGSSTTIVEADIDGNGTADLQIQLTGHITLAAGDFGL